MSPWPNPFPRHLVAHILLIRIRRQQVGSHCQNQPVLENTGCVRETGPDLDERPSLSVALSLVLGRSGRGYK